MTNAQIGDATNEAFLSSLGVSNFDVCIVAIGDNFQSSLEATSLLKELGAKMVVSRAARDVHAKFLLRNGADEVVYPEKQLAAWTAIRYSADHILDYIELDDEHAIFEVTIPEEWVGKTVGQLDIRKKYKINIMALKEDGQMDLGITPGTLLGDEATCWCSEISGILSGVLNYKKGKASVPRDGIPLRYGSFLIIGMAYQFYFWGKRDG